MSIKLTEGGLQLPRWLAYNCRDEWPGYAEIHMLAESYVATQLNFYGFKLYYWNSNNTSELDFVIHLNGDAIPIEVKSSDNVRARSLKTYITKYNPKYSIKISSKNFGFENNIKSIPLYAVFCIK